MPLPYPPGARALARPPAVEPCPACRAPLGRGYPTCLTCADKVDAHWQADWVALLAATGPDADERDLATTVLRATPGTHPWTCTDWAMRLLPCPACRSELGTGPSCVHCAKSDQARWVWDHTAPAGAITANEHTLRLAVAALRGADHHRDNILAYWRLTLPFLLVGEVPTPVEASRIRVHLLAGLGEDLAEAGSLAEMSTLTPLPWRSA
ncbi:hypothetical protein V5P93_000532 [Actinokineospora auranticolor]|uniref:Uncharacterized protein n=1 Tax=Actinokineospora auranticolor TaxID=155976 RepID=A0A2S6GZF5_9PSEU|nr:hypothetical protein [Actinokineospora auranticolor]PPK70588.1 hypothetical protein CLV40_102503 [Actinokineospora auranticolor]